MFLIGAQFSAARDKYEDHFVVLYEQIQHMAFNADNPANDQPINLWIITPSRIWTKRQYRSRYQFKISSLKRYEGEYDDAGRFMYSLSLSWFFDLFYNYTVRSIRY